MGNNDCDEFLQHVAAQEEPAGGNDSHRHDRHFAGARDPPSAALWSACCRALANPDTALLAATAFRGPAALLILDRSCSPPERRDPEHTTRTSDAVFSCGICSIVQEWAKTPFELRAYERLASAMSRIMPLSPMMLRPRAQPYNDTALFRVPQ